jgi:hypothetical protein
LRDSSWYSASSGELLALRFGQPLLERGQFRPHLARGFLRFARGDPRIAALGFDVSQAPRDFLLRRADALAHVEPEPRSQARS